MNPFITACFYLGVTLFAHSNNLLEHRLGERILILQPDNVLGEMMTIVDAGPSLVVIDTLASPKMAAEARKKAEHAFKKKVSHVLNTHEHWDHVFGILQTDRILTLLNS